MFDTKMCANNPSSDSTTLALRVTNLYLDTRNVRVLNGLSLQVPTGSIFGLIGPSGCGKTTLIRCIIGYLKPTSGQIHHFGCPHGSTENGVPGKNLGYMPQEIALNDDLTINEMLNYFGKLHIIDKSVLEKRKYEVLNLLNLVKLSGQSIGSLSGGQKRRVSFACAIIHRPKLVILDEPTVGCDPLLRENMWNFLTHLTTVDKLTVIVTTHYIEETKRAHLIGFMRCGKVLAQNNPGHFLRAFQCSSLEDCFLKLCTKDEKNSRTLKTICEPSQVLSQNPSVTILDHLHRVQNNNNSNPWDFNEDLNSFQKSYKTAIRTLITVTERILLRFLKQKPFLYGLFIVQLMGIVMFGTFFCQVPKNLPFGIFNEEPANDAVLSQLFVKNLETNRILSEIVQLHHFESKSDAQRAVKSGQIHGYLHFRANFSDIFMERFLMSDYMDTNPDALYSSTIEIRLDLTNKVISTTIERVLAINYQAFTGEILSLYNYSAKLGQTPVAISEPIYGHRNLEEGNLMTGDSDFFGVKDLVLPQSLSYLFYCYAIESVVFSLVKEKSELMFERNFALGVTTDQLLFAHFITNFGLNALFALPYFGAAVFLLSVPCQGSLILAYVTVLLQIALGVTTGMLFSASSLSFFLLSILVLGFVWTSFFLGNVMWPYEALPLYLKYIRPLIPFATCSDALRNIMVKGYNFFNPSIYGSYIWSLILISLILSITRHLFRYRQSS